MTNNEHMHSDAWTELGYSKPFVMPDLETQRVLVDAHAASPQMVANVKRVDVRAEDHSSYTEQLGLTGTAILSDEEKAAIHEFNETGKAESDARKIRDGEDPIVVAALRRAHEERKNR